MSDTQTALRDAALLTAGVAAAGLLAARPADARPGSRSSRSRSSRITTTSTSGTSYTTAALYFSAAPAATPGVINAQVPNTSKSNTTGSTDVQVLNFALALETLEAELYKEALMRLTTGGKDLLGNTITGLGYTTADKDVAYLTEFGVVESQHQAFLTSALGNNWVLDAGAVFDFGFADTNSTGNPALSRLQTVQLVYAAELTGVSAYLGGAGVLTPGSTNLTYAAAILGTEARHTTAVAIILNSPLFNENPKLETAPLSFENNGRDSPLTPDQILNTGGVLQGGITGTTLAGDGFINPVSGPGGFVYLPTTPVTTTGGGGTVVVLP